MNLAFMITMLNSATIGWKYLQKISLIFQAIGQRKDRKYIIYYNKETTIHIMYAHTYIVITMLPVFQAIDNIR